MASSVAEHPGRRGIPEAPRLGGAADGDSIWSEALREADEDVFAGPPDDQRRIDYLPTPAEIHSACRSIRQSWTRSEKRRRFVGDLLNEDENAWQPPVIDTTHFRISTNRGTGDGVR